MEAKKLLGYVGIPLTVALLLSLGFVLNPDDTHICRSLEITKHCNRLSLTEKTCYPTPGTRIGSKYCTSGWEDIHQPPVEKVIPSSGGSNIGSEWICAPSGCLRIR